MPTRSRFLLTAAVLAGAVFRMPGEVDAQGFTQFYGFGDSTMDSGYFRYTPTGNPKLPAWLIQLAVDDGAQGGFAGNGMMNTVLLAEKFGLTAQPSSNPAGGTNYANGGAMTQTPGPDSGNVPVYDPNPANVSQIGTYLQSVHGVADPRALYVVKSGDNDLNYSNPQNYTYLTQQAQYLAQGVQALQQAGARTILVPTSYNSALMAGLGGNIDPANLQLYANSQWYMSLRWQELSQLGVRFVPVDLDSVFRYVAQHPTAFGFTAQSVLATSAPLYNTPPYTAILASDHYMSQEQQQTYLFIDGKHLTTAGQTIEADYEYSLLVAPSQISLLAETVVQGGWARAATIQGQIDASMMQCRGPSGTNLWASMGAYGLKIKNAPGFSDESGLPYGGTVGIDYQLFDGFLIGAAFSAGSQTQDFSTGGGFDETDAAPSLYTAYKTGPFWSNAVLTWDMFQDDVSRAVPLGILTDENHGNTSGQSLAIALRGGVDLTRGRFNFGPVAGLIAQQAHVNGFTETGTTGVTALSFGSQTQNSCVGQLGWRLLVDLGRWQPFAEMDWDHEYASNDRTITTSLTSATAVAFRAPSYAMDAAPMVGNWGTMCLGAFYKVNSRLTLRGAASAMFMNPQMVTCGGEFGLNLGF